MRVTQHNSRTGSGGRVLGTAHNDRNYDTDKADNLLNDGDENIYWARGEHGFVTDGTITFEESEHNFYAKFLRRDLERQNAKALKARHRERVQDIDQYRKSRKHCPEEVILQIGDSMKHADAETLTECAVEYMQEMHKASKGHCIILNAALHTDEAVPHIHIRRAWLYKDDAGIYCTGQEKALEQAGVEPLCKREGRENDSRYCNRKIRFDADMREKWLDICERHQLEVERVPVPDGHHNRSKEEMIRDKYKDALETIATAENIIETVKDNADILRRLSDAEQESARDALQALADDLER